MCPFVVGFVIHVFFHVIVFSLIGTAGCKIGSDGSEFLAESLKSNTCLNKLDLCGKLYLFPNCVLLPVNASSIVF